MNKFSLIPALLFTSITFVSCGGNSDGGSSKTPQQEGSTGGTSGGAASLTFDSELSGSEKQALNSTTQMMSSLVINGGEARGFPQVFGGNSSANVVNYFETRVKYALSSSTDISDRLVFSVQPLTAPQYVAFNQGIALWYLALADAPAEVQVEINDQLLPITSSRIGIIQLGAPFIQFDTIDQVTTLVHEARHSDCTGGVLASDIERFTNGLPPLNSPCGHLHAICPPGHAYSGLAACDVHPWGAYAVGGIYASAVSLECTSCTETQKIVAQIIAIDAFSRLLYDINELLAGRYGPPDMSSSTQVR